MWPFRKKKKPRKFTIEELKAMGVSVLEPNRIEPNRIEPNRISPNRIEIHTVHLEKESPIVKKFENKA